MIDMGTYTKYKVLTALVILTMITIVCIMTVAQDYFNAHGYMKPEQNNSFPIGHDPDTWQVVQIGSSYAYSAHMEPPSHNDYPAINILGTLRVELQSKLKGKNNTGYFCRIWPRPCNGQEHHTVTIPVHEIKSLGGTGIPKQ